MRYRRHQLLLSETPLSYRWKGPICEIYISTSEHLEVEPVTVVFDGDSLVLHVGRQSLNIVLLDEVKEWFVTEHLSDLELMLVPALVEARLDVALVHIESPPVDLSACLTNEDAKGHVEVCALVSTTLNAESVEIVLCEYLLNELRLLRGLTLYDRLDLRWGNVDQVGIVRQVVVRLLLDTWCPGGLEPFWDLTQNRWLSNLRLHVRRLVLNHLVLILSGHLISRVSLL